MSLSHWTASRLKSALGSDLAREGLGDNFPVLHDEGVGADFEDVVCRLGFPHDVGGIAVHLLLEQIEGHAWLLKLLEQRAEELANSVGAVQHATLTEERRLVGVVGHGGCEVALAEEFEVVG